jgi:hypothetical protein
VAISLGLQRGSVARAQRVADPEALLEDVRDH